MIKLRVQCAVFGLLMSVQASAGSVLELLTTEYTQDPPILGTVEISTFGSSSRIEITSISSNESGGIIYNGDKREMIAIDHEVQQYYVIDEAMMNQMAAQVSDAMQQMQQALEEMPPEQRALAEQMMQVQIPQAQAEEIPKAVLNRTGESDSVGGYECEYYDVIREGKKIRDLCMTEWSDFEEGRSIAAAMMQLADFFESLRKAFAGAGGLEVMDRQQELFAYMDELDGYPVLSRDYDAAGQLKMESRLKSAGKLEEVNPALFEPPNGYRQQSLQ